MQVATRANRYFVWDWEYDDVKHWWVERSGACSCGAIYDEPCVHADAVAEFIKRTGRRATGEHDRRFPLPPPESGRCPVCGGAIEYVRDHRAPSVRWECPGNPVHFWLAYGEGKVEAFLTKPHPNKLVTRWIGMTQKEREEFLWQ